MNQAMESLEVHKLTVSLTIQIIPLSSLCQIGRNLSRLTARLSAVHELVNLYRCNQIRCNFPLKSRVLSSHCKPLQESSWLSYRPLIYQYFQACDGSLLHPMAEQRRIESQ